MGSDRAIVINGSAYPFAEGETILHVAQRNGIDIPTLCYLRGASPAGNCRVCLVEVEGAGDLTAACETLAVPGMAVRTHSSRVIRERRESLERLLASGHHNCLVQDLVDSWTDFQAQAMQPAQHQRLCPAYGECRLQDLALRYRARNGHPAPAETYAIVEDANPFFVRDTSRCILCGRCAQACNEVQVNRAIRFEHNGPGPRMEDLVFDGSACVVCGECVQACPVGALFPKKDLRADCFPLEAKKVRTTCAYCGVGCQVYLHVKDNRVVRITGVEDAAPNYGSMCVKGRFGYEFIHAPDRLKTPLIRENGGFREACWDEALDLVARELTRISRTSGPDSTMVLSSARITNEENYLAQKFARAVMGTNNIDHCARL